LYTSFSFTPPSPAVLYPLSLHDALPISTRRRIGLVLGNSCREPLLSPEQPVELPQQLEQGIHIRRVAPHPPLPERLLELLREFEDRKSTRLNSSHRTISYAVFCLKKKNK